MDQNPSWIVRHLTARPVSQEYPILANVGLLKTSSLRNPTIQLLALVIIYLGSVLGILYFVVKTMLKLKLSLSVNEVL